MDYIIDFLFGSIITFVKYLQTWYANAVTYGVKIDSVSIIGFIFLILIICGSGMAAATLAELKFRNRPVNFVLGIILPVIYPALIYFAMSTNEKNKIINKKVKKEVAPEKEIPASGIKKYKKNKEDDLEDIIQNNEEMNQLFFANIAKDESGAPRGPFFLELDDGQILEISKIVEPLQNVVSVQIGDDDKAKKIRLPYERIKSCVTKDMWNDESDINEDYYDDE